MLFSFDAIRSQVTSSRAQTALEFTNPDPAPWEAAAWFFYNANQVDVIFNAGSRLVGVNFLTEAGGVYQLLFVVPPALLVAAGLVITYRRPTGPSLRFDLFTGRLRYGANGALICLLGYLPLAVVGMFALFAVGTSVSVLGTLVKAGLIYPIVFGGIGGMLGMNLGPETTPEQEAADEWGSADGRW